MSLVIVGYLVLGAVELAWARRQGRAVHRFADTAANLACGACERLVLLIVGGVLFALYEQARRRLGLFAIEVRSPWHWAALLVAIDFAYYWLHRAHHRIAFLWAAHAVHHQSEELNFS